MLLERGERILQCRLALHAERDVPETPHPRRLPLGGFGVLDLEEVDRVALARERHEGAAVLRVLFQHLESEDIRVELLGALQVEYPKQDVTDFLELHHGVPSWGASVSPLPPAPKAAPLRDQGRARRAAPGA